MNWLCCWVVSFLVLAQSCGQAMIGQAGVSPTKTTVSFRTAPDHGVPLISAKINEIEDVVLIVDTGASLPALSKKLCDRFQLERFPLVRDGKRETFRGEPVSYVKVAKFKIGGLLFEDYPFMVLDNSILERVSKCHVDGYLGAAFMIRNSVMFDLKNREIAIWRGSVPQEDLRASGFASSSSVKLGMYGYLFTVPLKLSDSETEELILDTGSSQTTIWKATAKRVGLKEIGKVNDVSSLYGKTSFTKVAAPEIRLGDIPIQVDELVYPDNELPGMRPLLGLNVLSRARFLLDGPTKTLYTAAVKSANAP